MASFSLQRWLTVRAALLDDLESAHRAVRGSGPGVRAASLQINQAYAVLLSAQFQAFCRDLHTECAEQLVAPVADPDLRQLLLLSLMANRRIDRGNPNPGNIGADFNRFRQGFWPAVEASHSQAANRKTLLEELNDWRNAIAHQDFAASMLRASRPHLTLARVQGWRRACDGLAKSFDDVMKACIRALTGNDPW